MFDICRCRLSLQILLISSLSILAQGCNLGTNDGSEGVSQEKSSSIPVVFAMPKALSSSPYRGLRAKAEISGGSAVELLVHEDGSISGVLSNVAQGEHELVITYFMVIGSQDVVMARTEKTVSVLAGQAANVPIVEQDLNYDFDDDGDGYTNVAEVKVGVDPLDKYSRPQVSRPSQIGHVVLRATAENIVMAHSLMLPFSGVIHSPNFNVISGSAGIQK